MNVPLGVWEDEARAQCVIRRVGHSYLVYLRLVCSLSHGVDVVLIHSLLLLCPGGVIVVPPLLTTHGTLWFMLRARNLFRGTTL